MKYSFDSRIRFSETGENKCLTQMELSIIFQDCSTFQLRGYRRWYEISGRETSGMGAFCMADCGGTLS